MLTNNVTTYILTVLSHHHNHQYVLLDLGRLEASASSGLQSIITLPRNKVDLDLDRLEA